MQTAKNMDWQDVLVSWACLGAVLAVVFVIGYWG